MQEKHTMDYTTVEKYNICARMHQVYTLITDHYSAQSRMQNFREPRTPDVMHLERTRHKANAKT